eukprot:GCRY01003179.1.p1 GENE.GCRY01003179.1~~GCRY01003179.1.p1  ORF type:complete len:316 (-),score=31.43 GCRY01003179.1:302-1249(-)
MLPKDTGNQSELAPVADVLSLKAFYQDLVCGTVGGVLQAFAGHPFDTIKVRMQTQSSVNPLYRSMGDCFRQMVRVEGPFSLYKGVASPIVGLGLVNSCTFTSYHFARRQLKSGYANDEVMPLHRHFLAGCFAGMTTAFFDGPVELFKTKMQLQKSGADQLYVNTLSCFKSILKEYGVRGMFQGLSATLMRDIPGNAACYLSYHLALRTLVPGYGEAGIASIPTPTVLLAGGVGGIGYWVLAMPFDSIKTWMQSEPLAMSDRQYKNLFEAVKCGYARGGVKEFYRGFTPSLSRSFPAMAAAFLGYELTKKLAFPEQ